MESEGRRPLKVRSTRWATNTAAWLSRNGATPNSISAASVAMAICGGLAFLAAGYGKFPAWLGWTLGAVFVQLRLICNLLDGMVAVEGGKKTATGELWNEVPDRLADTILLVCAGIAVGNPWVGVLAAWGAVMTAYLRAFGASLTGEQDFAGPFAKPQRMAILTLAAIICAFESLSPEAQWGMKIALVVIAAGTILTAIRRTHRLASRLRSNES